MSGFPKKSSKISNTNISSSIFASHGSSNDVGSFNVPASTSSSGVRNSVTAKYNSKNRVESFTAYPTTQNVSQQQQSSATIEQQTKVGSKYYETVIVLENKTNTQENEIFFEIENVSVSCDRTLVEENMNLMKYFVLSENPKANHLQILQIKPVVFKEVIKYIKNEKDVSKLDMTYKDDIKTASELVSLLINLKA